MKPENLTPTFETCKRAKELGWEKETCFNWEIYANSHGLTTVNMVPNWGSVRFPAPTLAEILTELPDKLTLKRKDNLFSDFGILFWKDSRGNYRIHYEVNEDHSFVGSLTVDKNPAEAAARLWCWLKKEGHI